MATTEEQADTARANAVSAMREAASAYDPTSRERYFRTAEIWAKLYHADVLRGA